MDIELSYCPGCGARLPITNGPTHRYIGASAACWAIYSAMFSGGEPPIAPTPGLAQTVDAYAAQHPGTPSNQATQSVAVHLIALYAVFVKGTDLGRLVCHWLTPPDFTGSLNVADIANSATPQSRAELVERYIREVWDLWAHSHATTIAKWYDEFVVKD